jgi:hypothetical protein
MHTSEQYLSVFSNKYTEIYNYIGLLEHETITRILRDIKSVIQADYIIERRIYGIVNEMLENTMIHQKSTSYNLEIAILKNKSSYRIITFNTSTVDEVQSFLENSSDLNTLSSQELKDRYRKKLLTSEINDKGTIGVGMELVRIKSRNKILISTEENSGQSIVIIDVKVDH